MRKTLKVKTAGRFGSRYGVGIRKRIIKVETLAKRKHRCPDCGFDRVKRVAAGIYVCRKCKLKFAGGAYIPETMSGNIVRKMVLQKSFLPLVKDLISAKEEQEKEPPKEPRQVKEKKQEPEQEPEKKNESAGSEKSAEKKAPKKSAKHVVKAKKEPGKKAKKQSAKKSASKPKKEKKPKKKAKKE